MNASAQPLIRLDGIKKVFYTDEVETHALAGIHLEIQKGEYIAIAGPSGCGKSTMLAILGLLDTPTDGTYMLNGQQVSNLSLSERARVRNREIGFIFQSFNLIGDLNVYENVELPLTYRGMKSTERKERVMAALDLGHPHVRQGELHVLVDTQVADEVEALEDEPDLAVPRARALDDRQALDRPIVQPVLALRGCVEQAEDRQERRLAATRRSFDRDVLTEVDREVDAVESVGHDFVALENLADAFQTDQRVCHRVLFPLRLYLICSRSTWSQADMSERITRSPCCNPSTT